MPLAVYERRAIKNPAFTRGYLRFWTVLDSFESYNGAKRGTAKIYIPTFSEQKYLWYPQRYPQRYPPTYFSLA